MKNTYPIIIIIFFTCLIFCTSDEKYTFIYGGSQRLELGEKWTYRITHETSFTIPEIGFVKYSGKYIEKIEFIGFDGEFWKFKATLTDIETDNYVNGIEILDQYREAMEDNPCYLYVKRSGFDDFVDHIDPIDPEFDYLQDAFEAAHMHIYPKRFKYPFGRSAVDVAIGERWRASYDSSRFYVNIGSPPSFASSSMSFFIRKVKKQRGKNIAIVEMEELNTLELRLAVNFLGERRLITGHATGTTDMTSKWNLDSGERLKNHTVSNLVGDFEMDNETFHMKIFTRYIAKMVR